MMKEEGCWHLRQAGMNSKPEVEVVVEEEEEEVRW